jgi:CTP synthase (UTP-ammonia lyase)
MTDRPARLALIGDRSPLVQAHARIPDVLDGLGSTGRALDAYWIQSAEVADTDLRGFDGIWVVPGSPYADIDGVLAAIRFAREHDVAFLGTCGGFQHMLLEFARHVCELDVDHGESSPDAIDPLIRKLECSLLGEERIVHVVAGTRAATILGTAPRTERYFCSYGLDQRYVGELCSRGLVVGGRDDAGEVRLAELADRRFFMGSLFQPELSSTRTWVHPLIAAFVAADRGDQVWPSSPVVSPGAELPGTLLSSR